MRITPCRLFASLVPLSVAACGVPIDSLAIGVEDDISTTSPDPNAPSNDPDGSASVDPQIDPLGVDSSVANESDAAILPGDAAVPPTIDSGSKSDAGSPTADAAAPADSGVRCKSANDCASDDDVCLDIGVANVCVPCALTIARRDPLECQGGGKCRYDKGKLACQ